MDPAADTAAPTPGSRASVNNPEPAGTTTPDRPGPHSLSQGQNGEAPDRSSGPQPQPESSRTRTHPDSQSQSQSQAQPPSSTNPSDSAPAPDPNPNPHNAPYPSHHPTEEPELGPRASRLKSTFGAALSRTLAALDYDAFAACFPTVAAARPATLRAFWEQFRNRVGEVCLAEFDGVVADRDVVRLLNRLDGLIADAKRRRAAGVVGRSDGEPGENAPIPPHTLSPTSILKAHLRPHLRSTHAALEAELARSRGSTVRLAAQVRAQRAGLNDKVAALERVVAEIRAAVVGPGGPVGALDGGLGVRTGGPERGSGDGDVHMVDGGTHDVDGATGGDGGQDGDAGGDTGDDERRKKRRLQDAEAGGLGSLTRLEVGTVQMEELVTAMARE